MRHAKPHWKESLKRSKKNYLDIITPSTSFHSLVSRSNHITRCQKVRRTFSFYWHKNWHKTWLDPRFLFISLIIMSHCRHYFLLLHLCTSELKKETSHKIKCFISFSYWPNTFSQFSLKNFPRLFFFINCSLSVCITMMERVWGMVSL